MRQTILRDQIIAINIARFSAGEIKLQDLAYKYFAYVLD